jgi:DNA-binding PadR family transcriptional regulator
MRGYEIRKEIAESTSFFWTESNGQLYPALKKCIEKDFIHIQAASTLAVGKDKKIYAIPRQGESHLQNWLTESVRKSTVRNELLLKLFFGNNASIENNINHLQNKTHELEQGLQTYLVIKQNLANNQQKSPHLPYWLMTLEYGISQSESYLKWCRRSITTLKKLRSNK